MTTQLQDDPGSHVLPELSTHEPGVPPMHWSSCVQFPPVLAAPSVVAPAGQPPKTW